MKSILLLLGCAATIATVPAAVTLSFDSSTDGFAVVGPHPPPLVWVCWSSVVWPCAAAVSENAPVPHPGSGIPATQRLSPEERADGGFREIVVKKHDVTDRSSNDKTTVNSVQTARILISFGH